MKIENRTPHQDGFYMPGEFEPQDGVILIWPKRPGSWPYEQKKPEKYLQRLPTSWQRQKSIYADRTGNGSSGKRVIV